MGAGTGQGRRFPTTGEGLDWDPDPPHRPWGRGWARARIPFPAAGGEGQAWGSLSSVGEWLVRDMAPRGAGEGPTGTRGPLSGGVGLGEGRAGADPLAVLPAGVGALAAAAPRPPPRRSLPVPVPPAVPPSVAAAAAPAPAAPPPHSPRSGARSRQRPRPAAAAAPRPPFGTETFQRPRLSGLGGGGAGAARGRHAAAPGRRALLGRGSARLGDGRPEGRSGAAAPHKLPCLRRGECAGPGGREGASPGGANFSGDGGARPAAEGARTLRPPPGLWRGRSPTVAGAWAGVRRAPCSLNNTPMWPLPKVPARGARAEAVGGGRSFVLGRGRRLVSLGRPWICPPAFFVCRPWGWWANLPRRGRPRGGGEPHSSPGAGRPAPDPVAARRRALERRTRPRGCCFRGAETVKEVGSPCGRAKGPGAPRPWRMGGARVLARPGGVRTCCSRDRGRGDPPRSASRTPPT